MGSPNSNSSLVAKPKKPRGDYAAYCCVVGRYDRECAPQPDEDECLPIILFSESVHVASDGGQRRPLCAPPYVGTAFGINRWHKCFPDLCLPEYRYTAYFDGNVRWRGSLPALFEAFKASGMALAIFRHPRGHDLLDEAVACRNYMKFDALDCEKVVSQFRFYRACGFPLTQTVGANYFILRDSAHPYVNHAMSVWWEQLQAFTKRDQLSLLYALREAELPWCFLEDLGIDFSVHRVPHRGRGKTAVRELWGRLRPRKWTRERLLDLIGAP